MLIRGLEEHRNSSVMTKIGFTKETFLNPSRGFYVEFAQHCPEVGRVHIFVRQGWR